MHTSVAFLAAMAAAAHAAVPQGFNYGATKPDNTAWLQSDFEGFFKQAQSLPGNSGFTSARLYTMMEAGTTKVTGAIPAAISTKTTLLLGMWVSTGKDSAYDTAFKAELAALKAAVDQYGDQLKDLVVGISVGSEDMYRISSQGQANPNAGPGQEADAVSNFIQQTKDYLKGTSLSSVPVGHVDTWTAWTNGTNTKAITAADFLGVDLYPEWQTDSPNNSIDQAKSLFDEAMGKVSGVSQGKPLWITETGWGVKGPTEKDAVASVDNAKTYYQQIGCPNFGKTPIFWYTLQETPTSTNPDFSVFDVSSGKPYFDLSCDNIQTTSSDNSTSTGTSTGASSTSTGTGSSTSSGSTNGTVTSGTPSMPSTGSGSGSSGSGSSGSGSSGSGTGSGSGSGSGSKTGSATGSATSAVSTGSAATMSVLSAGSLLAIAAAVAALL